MIGLSMWVTSMASGTGGLPFEDAVLDSGAWNTKGTLTETTLVAESTSGPVWRLDYTFEVVIDGEAKTFPGSSYSGIRLPYNPGNECTIEYNKEDPAISRIRGTQRVYIDQNVAVLVFALVLPGILLFYRWIRHAFRLRIMLREGRLSTAQIIESQLVRWVNPSMVKTHFRFQDQRGTETISIQWILAGSGLGQRLLQENPRENPVIHSEEDAQLCYLVGPADFLTEEL